MKDSLVAFQDNLIPHVYDSYNVTTCPMKIVTINLYPMGVFLLEISAHGSKTIAHKAVLIPPTYTTSILHFLIVSISSCSWMIWRKVNVRKCKNLTRRGKNLYFGHNVFLLPSIISKFCMQSWFEIILK